MTDRLLIFLKNPERSEVKTRLAAELGETKARSIYYWLTCHTLNIAQSSQLQITLCFTHLPDPALYSQFELYQQRGNSLGDRLNVAFEDLKKPGQKIMVIGSDCPEISANHLHQALHSLNKHDAVIGPSFDGGFYLAGFNQLPADIWNKIAWSTETACQDLEKNLIRAGLTYDRLEKLHDIDRPEDFYLFEYQYETFNQSRSHVTKV